MTNNNIEIKRTKGKEIIEYQTIKKVVASGTGAVIYLPKELIGKEVRIEYKK